MQTYRRIYPVWWTKKKSNLEIFSKLNVKTPRKGKKNAKHWSYQKTGQLTKENCRGKSLY